jgi:hypothetical protein
VWGEAHAAGRRAELLHSVSAGVEAKSIDVCLVTPAAERQETQDGAEVHMATNCLGPHLLTLLLLPCLRAAAQVRSAASAVPPAVEHLQRSAQYQHSD